MNPFILHKSRIGETQFGDILKERNEDDGTYIFIVISEDIGIRANGGRPGAAGNSSLFWECIASLQVNAFLPANKFGWSRISVDDLQNRSLKYSYPDDKIQLRSLVDEVDKRVHEKIKYLLKEGKIPLVLGGGHNNAFPLLNALHDSNGKSINALNLDPHSDTRELEGRHSGNPFSYAKEAKFLKNYAVLGLHESAINEMSLKKFNDDPNWTYFSFEEWAFRGNTTFSKSLDLAIQHVSKSSVFGLEICADGIKGCPCSAAIQHGWSWEQVFDVAFQSGQTGRCEYIHLAEVALPLADPNIQMSIAKSSIAVLLAFIKGYEQPHF